MGRQWSDGGFVTAVLRLDRVRVGWDGDVVSCVEATLCPPLLRSVMCSF